jgi:hypothetical protein
MVVNGVNIYNELKNKVITTVINLQSYEITEDDISNVCKFSDKLSFYSLTVNRAKKIREFFGIVIYPVELLELPE